MRRTSSRAWLLAVLAGGAALAACTGRACNSPGTATAPGAANSASASAAVDWARPVVVARGDAHAGPWRMNDSQFHYVDDPTVHVAGDGTAHVPWVDNRQKDVFFQKYGKDGRALFAGPVNVSKSPGIFSWLPRVVAGQAGELFLLWEEIVFSGGSHGGEAFFARSVDGGRTFSEPVNLSNSTAGCGKGRLTQKHWHNGSLDIARGLGGDLFVAWTEYEGALSFRRSADAGLSFSETLHVAGDDARPARGPSLAVGPDGTVYLAFAVGEDPSADIQLTHSVDAGKSFDRARPVAKSAGYSDAPKIAVDERATLHLIWAERDQGFFGPAELRYARRASGAPTFETPRRLPPVASGAGADFPALALGAAGNVVLVWEHHPDGAQRAYGLGFTASRDGGNTFAAATLVGEAERSLGTNGSQQGKLMDKLAVSETGHIAVVNSRFRAGDQSLVQLFRAVF